MTQPFNENLSKIADSMGISLYQRFTPVEASLFLRCPLDDIHNLQKQNKIDFIQVTDKQVEFFGYQLLDYLLSAVTNNTLATPRIDDLPDRIVRAKEVQEMTGLSRTTLWRLEKKGDFPHRVSLGVGSVGWKFSEITHWLNSRQNV